MERRGRKREFILVGWSKYKMSQKIEMRWCRLIKLQFIGQLCILFTIYIYIYIYWNINPMPITSNWYYQIQYERDECWGNIWSDQLQGFDLLLVMKEWSVFNYLYTYPFNFFKFGTFMLYFKILKIIIVNILMSLKFQLTLLMFMSLCGSFVSFFYDDIKSLILFVYQM